MKQRLDELASHPERFDFFSAVRLLDALHPGHPRTGHALRPGREPVRLDQEPVLSFSYSDVAAFTPGEGDRPARLASYFFGLFGPNGPMPQHLTEYVRERSRQSGDPSFARFADMFHHRLLSFMYRAWADAEPCVQLDRPGEDAFQDLVAALVGIRQPQLRRADAMPGTSKLGHAGLLGMLARPPSALASLLAGQLELPVTVEEYVGEWLDIPGAERARLGVHAATASIGRAVLGERSWQCQQRFRLHVGPLAYHDFLRLLPGGQDMRLIESVVDSFVGDELAWDVHLTLAAGAVPALALGRTGQLGWTTWINERRGSGDEVLVRPRQCSAVIENE